MPLRQSWLRLNTGVNFKILMDERLGELIQDGIDKFLAGPAAGAGVEPEKTEVYRLFVEPKQIKKLRGTVDGGLKRLADFEGRAIFQAETMKVKQLRTPAEWAYQANQTPKEEEFFRIGPWVIRQAPKDSYMSVVGNAVKQQKQGGWFNMDTGYETIKPDYAAMWTHFRNGPYGKSMPGGIQGKDVAQLLRRLLNGGEERDVPASIACLAGAVFLSESRHEKQNLLAGPMILDLLQFKSLEPEKINAMHPTAYGGGLRDKGTARDRVLDVAMEWYEFVAQGVTSPVTEEQVGALVEQRLASPAVGHAVLGPARQVLTSGGAAAGGGDGGSASGVGGGGVGGDGGGGDSQA